MGAVETTERCCFINHYWVLRKHLMGVTKNADGLLQKCMMKYRDKPGFYRAPVKGYLCERKISKNKSKSKIYKKIKH